MKNVLPWDCQQTHEIFWWTAMIKGHPVARHRWIKVWMEITPIIALNRKTRFEVSLNRNLLGMRGKYTKRGHQFDDASCVQVVSKVVRYDTWQHIFISATIART